MVFCKMCWGKKLVRVKPQVQREQFAFTSSLRLRLSSFTQQTVVSVPNGKSV
jgi:hypothetical protein